MVTKTYQSLLWTRCDFAVKLIDGTVTTCHFANGVTYPAFRGGRFQTSNPTIQHALDNHIKFNKEYILVGVDGKEDVVIPAIKESLPATHKDISPGGDIGIDDTLVYHVKNATEAKKWLKENKSATNEDVKNVPAIDKYCKDNHILFPDWLTNRGLDVGHPKL